MKVLYCFFYGLLLLLSACQSQAITKSLQVQNIHSIAAGKSTEIVAAEKSTEIFKHKPASVMLEADLWQYIVNRSVLSAPSQKDLFWHIDWFKKHPDYLTRVTKRASPYLYLITQEVERAKLPIEIALLPIVESAYYPFAYSHGSASGLWQFIPSTGKLYGLKDDWWYDGRRDVLASTKAAVKYLKNLSKLFKGDYLLAIAAYNSGPGRVQKAILKNKKLGKKTDFWHLDLPLETRGYVPRLLAVAELIKHPELYGQTITTIENKPAVQGVKLTEQFDLALIAQWTQLSLEDIYLLNPGLKRWTTPNKERYTLLLPIDKVSEFERSLAAHPKEDRIKWVRHKIAKGENLIVIARRYKSTVAQIKSVNSLHDNTIKSGEYLIVPVAQKQPDYYSLSETQRSQRRMNVQKNGFKVVHMVEKGDSLWKISHQYNVYVDDIVKWNHIDKKKPLQIGQKLAIWQLYKPKVKDLSRITKVGMNINRTVTYTAKPGDNLSKIARKFHTSVAKLKTLNGLSDNKSLQLKQKLKIIVNVVNNQMR